MPTRSARSRPVAGVGTGRVIRTWAYGRDQPGSWCYHILPFIEEEALYKLGADGDKKTITTTQRNGAVQRDRTPVAIFFCPTRRPARAYPKLAHPYETYNSVTASPGEIAYTDYAANAGPTTRNNTPYDPQIGFESTHPARSNPGGTMRFPTDADWPAYLPQQQGVIYGGSQVKHSQITDGTSKTYLVGEKYHVPTAYFDGTDFTDTESAWSGNNDDNHRVGTLAPTQDQVGLLARDYRAFGSAHSAIWQVAWCDGSVDGISYDIDLTVHRQNCSRAGSEGCAEAAATARAARAARFVTVGRVQGGLAVE